MCLSYDYGYMQEYYDTVNEPSKREDPGAIDRLTGYSKAADGTAKKGTFM